jgi:hypothetical protein
MQRHGLIPPSCGRRTPVQIPRMSNDTVGASTAGEPSAALSGKLHDSFRNEHHKFFTLGTREFPVKDLGYDDYIEFVRLSKPLLTVMASTMELTPKDGDLTLDFDPTKLDMDVLLDVAGDDLPKMAWICCRQSDPKIALSEVKALARRPWAMLQVVLQQVKQNDLVKEFADFFPHLAKSVEDLIPQATAAMTPSTPSREAATRT